MEEKGDEHAAGNCTADDQRAGFFRGQETFPTLFHDLGRDPRGSVNDYFGNNDPTEPAVDQVVCIESDACQSKKRIVAASEEKERKHIPHRKRPRAIDKGIEDITDRLTVVDLIRCQGNGHD